MGSTGKGICKCGGKFITARKAKKLAYKQKRHEKMLEAHKKKALEREIKQLDMTNVTVRQHLKNTTS